MKNNILNLGLVLMVSVGFIGIQSCDDKMKDLVDTKWTLEKITTAYGQELIPTKYYTVLISEDMLHLKLDVNACKLNYTLKGENKIEINKMGICTRACCDSDMAISFKDKLIGEMELSLEGDRLTLSGKDVLSFTRWKESDVNRSKTEDYLKIKRTGCFGTCPIYEMTLFNDGTAKYLGKRFVEVTGKKDYTFDVSRVKDLMNRAKRLDFKSLQPVYDNPSISDMEAVFIEYNGVVIKVRYEEDVPAELLKLIKDVHQCSIDANWVKSR